MPLPRALVGLLLCSAAASAQQVEPLIARPITLPRGAVDLTLHGTYTNWTIGGTPGSDPGETLALGVDFGATDRVQLGLAMAFPINPGAAFGSILGNATFAMGKELALRLDGGYERFALNGGSSISIDRYLGGLGARIKIPLSPSVAFVSGRAGAVHFGHFNNLGEAGFGFYEGSSFLTELSSDFLVLSAGSNDSPTRLGINLPLGVLFQPDPHFALTLLAGYSAVIDFPHTGSSATAHFLPIGLEVVGTPVPWLDIGARFLVDGFVAQSSGSSNTGYLDFRTLMLWFRFGV